MRRLLATALLPLALAACEDDDVTGPEVGEATVAIQFAATTPTASASAASASLAQTAQQEELVLTGTNGDRLVLTDVFLIVSEFELERAEGACLNEEEEDEDECEEFEARPFLIDLPLGSAGVIEVVTDEVPLGTYTELEFEVEDLDLEDDEEEEDEAFRQAVQNIRGDLAAAFPEVGEVPEEASLFVRGSFITAEGEERPFTSLFEAEIEVEQEFVPALVIDEEGASRVVTVNLDPAALFGTPEGVLDLSQFDFATTGEVTEFEFDAEEGFEVETDDEDDDD
jgi:hypothetical protein